MTASSNSQLIEITRILVSSKKSLKIVINFFTMFCDARIFSFEKQKMAIRHHWVNDENDEAHVYKLILVFQGKENEINQKRTY